MHRLLNHCHQLLAQLRQVHLITKAGTKGFQSFGGVVLPTLEAAVDDPLDVSSQGLEQNSNNKRRNHDGDIVILVDHPPEQVLQGNDETKVDQSKESGQGAIHKGAVDEDINVPQPVT
ncbi:MAG TPA: hypothetical protein VF026_05465 [Ktedonobacteraceae bacterium]